jgi:hypothetical protein
MTIHRRSVISALAGFVFIPFAKAESTAKMTVYKDPSCGCCGAWVNHVQKAGFSVDVIKSDKMNTIKAQYGVPDALRSCHTAEIGGYVIEGHVPSAEITRLLNERPVAKGLAVAGMPMNSPGMEVSGSPAETYSVMLFDGGNTPVPYAVYKGSERIS